MTLDEGTNPQVKKPVQKVPLADDGYPAEWFPGVTRRKEQAQRSGILQELEQMPTGVLAKALADAKRAVEQGGNELA
jgi:hypothetical protein